MKYTNEFSKIDTEIKAYILGLLTADGCVAFNQKSGAYSTTLKLKEEDGYLLDGIVNHFPFFRQNKPEVSKSGFTSRYIRHYSKQMSLDLIALNVHPRKSFENSNKVRLPVLNDKMFIRYLHGFMDGDGTINQSKLGHIRIDIAGTNELLYRDIQKRLSNLGIESNVYYRASRNYWMLRISKKDSIQKLITLFSSNNFCLQRKFKPYFNADWDRIPCNANKGKDYSIWFVTTATKQVHPE